MPIRVGMVSLGCSKNLVDSERMLFKLRKHGYTLVKEPLSTPVVLFSRQKKRQLKRFWNWQN